MNRAKRRTAITAALGALVIVAVAVLALAGRSWISLFVTPDQQGDRLLRRGRFEDAAGAYTDPLRQGVALYRAAKFEDAARAFARAPGPTGSFNQGNALLMRGSYDKAIAAYDGALELRPGWVAAEENRALAAARRERVKKEGGDVTGGEVEPDEIVLDLNKRGGQEAETDTENGAPMSESELSALWLRCVQTTPGDFLRAKFAYQAARGGQGGAEP